MKKFKIQYWVFNERSYKEEVIEVDEPITEIKIRNKFRMSHPNRPINELRCVEHNTEFIFKNPRLGIKNTEVCEMCMK